jgi:hypothetical protein
MFPTHDLSSRYLGTFVKIDVPGVTDEYAVPDVYIETIGHIATKSSVVSG